MSFFKEEIQNIGIVFTLFTAILFGTGWVYEGIVLEEFKINSDEFLPDPGALITYGFTVIFFKFFDHWSSLVYLGMLLGPGIIGGRELLNKHPEWKAHLHVKGARITFVGVLPLLIGAWFMIVADFAKKEASSIVDTKEEDIQWLNLKGSDCSHKGRVIRYRDGKMAFMFFPSESVAIIPERNIYLISGNKLLNKSSQGTQKICAPA